MIVLLSLLVTLFVQCPMTNIFIPQWLIYHLPTFLLGALVSIHRDVFYKSFKGKEVYLLLLVVIFALLQAIYYPGYGSLHKPLFQAALPDVQMLQKICLSFFFMIFLHRYEKSKFAILDSMAATSFAIYFLHFYVLCIVEWLFRLKLFHWEWIVGPVLWLCITLVVTLSCIALARISRHFFRSYSRLLIGY
jgi:peptidoglycan/LPS O-acetylase OafA/YrhL